MLKINIWRIFVNYNKCEFYKWSEIKFLLNCFVLIMFLTPLFLHGQVNTVSKPVGLIRMVVPTNSETVVSAPFDLLPSAGINDVFGNQLTGSTNEIDSDAIRVWDSSLFQYVNAYKFDTTTNNSVWLSDFSGVSTSSLSFYPGNGFYIANRQFQPQTILMYGYVVLDDEFTIPVYPGLNLLSYPYASKVEVNATTLSEIGQELCETSGVTNKEYILQPNSGAEAWLENDVYSDNYLKWLNSFGELSNLELNIGEGFWYMQQWTNVLYWAEPIPYENYFPANTNPPIVIGMSPNAEKTQITLEIETTGDYEEQIEIYYQDLTMSQSFHSLGWSIGATNILTQGLTLVEWTDAGSSNRPSIDNVFSRYYLVGRGDIDSDNDTLPDSRETFVYGTSSQNADSDNDTLNDGDEVSIYNTDPLLSDTDADGLDDGLEVKYGKDPSNKGNYSFLPFIENFETNTVHAGTINNQNNWEAEPESFANVQTGVVYNGNQSMKILSQDTNVVVRHLFASPESAIVWVDMVIQVFPAVLHDDITDAAACFAFGQNGRLCVYDGVSSSWIELTNCVAFEEGEWVRITTMCDYSNQQWLICLNGKKVADGLAFASYIEKFSSLTLSGKRAYTDNIHISTDVPEGVDADSDNIDDAWELRYFGTVNVLPDEDPDGDGLSNLEEFNAGTDPHNSDSDDDGINDGIEIEYSNDPLVSNSYMNLPFVENFEEDTVSLGELNGQNNWEAAPASFANVQTNFVYQGRQSMKIYSQDTNVVVQHLFSPSTSSVVWLDFMLDATASAVPTEVPKCAALFGFNNDGCVWYYDGGKSLEDTISVVTNIPPFAEGEKVRLSVKLNYETQKWLICINGLIAQENIGFASFVKQFTALKLSGGKCLFDGLTIAEQQPSELSLDYDNMPDEWEIENFGNTDQGDDADYDSDGLSNLEEYIYGTDPCSTDSDNDEMPDAWELNNGLNPLDPNDAALDFDNDGLTNLVEYQNELDPRNADCDGDGLLDGEELNFYNTDPLNVDSDGDGYTDLGELNNGFDPIDSDSYPKSEWEHRIKLSLQENVADISNKVSNIPIPVILDLNKVDYSQFALNGLDIIVDDSFGNDLNIEISSWNTNGSSIIWVLLPEIDSDSSVDYVWLHWGNTSYTNLQDSSTVWSNNYKGVWHLEDSGAILDSTLNSSNAVNLGVSEISGLLGGALTFGGQYVQIPATAFGTVTNEITISMWQYGMPSILSDYYLFGGESDNASELSVLMPASNERIYWNTCADIDNINEDAEYYEYSEQWNNWSFTKNSTTGIMNIYLNGDIWRTDVGNTNSFETITSFYLGADSTGDDVYHGLIDEFSVSDVERSASWIKLQHLAMLDKLFVYGDSIVSIVPVQDGIEAGVNAVFKISRFTEMTNFPLVVEYQLTANTTASENEDFSSLSGFVTIPAGETEQLIDIDILDDVYKEDNEVIELALIPGSYGFNTNNIAQVMVIDNDVDLDSDGMSDAWEAKYGVTDPDADEDGDGQTNLQEYLNRTCPILQDGSFFDSENNLIGDGSYDPSQASIITNVAAIDGSSISDVKGIWGLDGTAVYSDQSRGSVLYSFNIETSDIYRIECQLAEQLALDGVTKGHAVRFIVDDVSVAYRTISINGYSTVNPYFYTPFLNVGEHTIEILMDGANKNQSLRINQILVQSLDGTDSNTNGQKDWVENCTTLQNTIGNIIQESKISPVSCEGTALYPELISINGVTNSAFAGPNKSWFADVELSAEGAIATNMFSMENGARILQRQMRWDVTDLISEPDVNWTIRKGDAMRLTASHPSAVTGNVQIAVNDTIIGSCELGSAIVYRFNTNGEYVVTGTLLGEDVAGNPVEEERSITVNVVGVDEETIAAIVGRNRSWTNSVAYPSETVIEWDSSLDVSGNKSTLVLKTGSRGNKYAVVRLKDSGAVLGQLKITGLYIPTMSQNGLFFDEILDDGSYTAITDMIMYPKVSDVYIVQQIRGATTYMDGSSDKILYPEDFTENGICRIYLYHPSVSYEAFCRYSKVYQNGVLLGVIY